MIYIVYSSSLLGSTGKLVKDEETGGKKEASDHRDESKGEGMTRADTPKTRKRMTVTKAWLEEKHSGY